MAANRKTKSSASRRAASSVGVRQFKVLTRRYVQTMIGDWKNLAVLLALAPVVAALLCVLARSIEAPDDPLTPAEFSAFAKKQNTLCFGSVLTLFFLGLFASIREIVKELNIYRHERFINLRLAPYILSKVVPLAVIDVVIALLFLFVVSNFGGLQAGNHFQQLYLAVLTAFAGTAMGLAISASVPVTDRAVLMMIGVVIPQMLFAGAIVQIADGDWSAFIAKPFIACYWAQEAFTALLDERYQLIIDPGTREGGDSWFLASLFLPLHSAVYLVATAFFMARKDGPGVIKRWIQMAKELRRRTA